MARTYGETGVGCQAPRRVTDNSDVASDAPLNPAQPAVSAAEIAEAAGADDLFVFRRVGGGVTPTSVERVEARAGPASSTSVPTKSRWWGRHCRATQSSADRNLSLARCSARTTRTRSPSFV